MNLIKPKFLNIFPKSCHLSEIKKTFSEKEVHKYHRVLKVDFKEII